MFERSPPIPAGIFLDTSVVAYLETYGAPVFDGELVDETLPAQLQEQIEALRVLMALAGRARLAFAVSPAVVAETGGRYVQEIADHWEIAPDEWGIQERGLAPMTIVASLPAKDQLIIAEAYRSGCEVVLTNDLAWIKKRHQATLAALGMYAYTPSGLVDVLGPWLGLWL